MRLCNETVSVVNSYMGEDGLDAYRITTLSGVSWYESVLATVDDGLKAASKYVLRIPENVDAGGSVYVPPEAFQGTDGTFTLRSGDTVVKAPSEALDGLSIASIHKRYPSMTILGVTDNRRAQAPHWKVVGA